MQYTGSWSAGQIGWLTVAFGVVNSIQPVYAADPLDMGARLEQAAAACEQQNSQQLQTISREIRQLVQQQPALQAQRNFIEQLLGLFQAGVCKPGQQALRPQQVQTGQVVNVVPKESSTQLLVSAGYLDNVNQGTRHERISIIDPLTGALVEGRLDDNYLPLSSPYVGVQGIQRQLKNGGKTMVYAGAFQQVYSDEPNFNTTGLSLGRQQKHKNGRESSVYVDIIRDAKGNTRNTLGGSSYQPWVASEQKKAGWSVGVEYATYPQQTAYNALSTQLAVEHHQVLPKGGEWAVKGKLEYESARHERPGGDRREAELSTQWQGQPLAKGWQPTAGAKIAYKLDEQPFDQKLFGASKRAQTRTSVDLGLNKQLDSRHKLYLNYQYSKTQDKEVPLFDQPAGNTVGIALETNF